MALYKKPLIMGKYENLVETAFPNYQKDAPCV
jgi:hypothetical protein